MKRCARTKLVPIAVCAMGLLALVLAGCRKEEKAPEAAIPKSSPKSYMNDKKFMNTLAEQKKERQLTMKRHHEARELYKAALKDDPKCEKPETQELKKKMEAIEDEYQNLRKKTMATIQERLAPEKKTPKTDK